MHVVLHCGEFATTKEARAAADELVRLRDELGAYEESNPDSTEVPPRPLADFASRHGFVWPDGARFLLKHRLAEVEVETVGHLVFFHAGGLELGGDGIREFFRLGGALAYSRDGCALDVYTEESELFVESLSSYLDDSDFADQYSVDDSEEIDRARVLFSIRFVDTAGCADLLFYDGGVEDWAFINALPRLAGTRPVLDVVHVRTEIFSEEGHRRLVEASKEIVEKNRPETRQSSTESGEASAEAAERAPAMTAAEQAERLLGALVEKNAIAIVDDSIDDSLIEGFIALAERHDGRLSPKIVYDWLFDHDSVEDVFVDERELAELLTR